MIEHRLIEKMIAVIQKEIRRLEREKIIHPEFIDVAVDFIRTYADRCHHGKEEEILFRELNRKELATDLRRIMEELIEEHRQGRQVTTDLATYKEAYLRGDREAMPSILNRLRFMVEFYPQHIKKEDKSFFLPCMDYFTPEEKSAMLAEEYEFDKHLIHELYTDRVTAVETLF
jgi:hemerythrin-like domain-containing protein